MWSAVLGGVFGIGIGIVEGAGVEDGAGWGEAEQDADAFDVAAGREDFVEDAVGPDAADELTACPAMLTRAVTAWRRRTAAAAAAAGGDRGSWSVEVAGFFIPCMLLAIVVVAAAFQLAISRLDLESASAAAARAASLQPSAAAATTAAEHAAESDLAGRAVTCADLVVTVDISRWQRGGSVTVTVRCTVDLSTLAMANAIPGQMTASSTSTAPIDTYRSVAVAASLDHRTAGNRT